MSESKNEQKPPTDDSTHGPLEYKERVDHFAAGYDNSQSVVRFLDTKASAVIAAVPVVVGLLVGMYRWFDAGWNWEKVTAFAGSVTPALLLAIVTAVAAWLLVNAFGAVVAAFNALSPQSPGKTFPSVLFPYNVPKDPNPSTAADADFPSRTAFFTADAGRSDVIEDYRRQIVRMSEIVERKLGFVNKAISHLKLVFVSALIITAALFILTVGSTIVARQKPAAAATSHTAKPVPPQPPPAPRVP